jgi:hypothetical protein
MRKRHCLVITAGPAGGNTASSPPTTPPCLPAPSHVESRVLHISPSPPSWDRARKRAAGVGAADVEARLAKHFFEMAKALEQFGASPSLGNFELSTDRRESLTDCAEKMDGRRGGCGLTWMRLWRLFRIEGRRTTLRSR